MDEYFNNFFEFIEDAEKAAQILEQPCNQEFKINMISNFTNHFKLFENEEIINIVQIEKEIGENRLNIKIDEKKIIFIADKIGKTYIEKYVNISNEDIKFISKMVESREIGSIEQITECFHNSDI